AGTDELRDLDTYGGWLRAHGLPDRSTSADLDAARRLRAALRSAVGDSADPAPAPTEVAVPVRVGLDSGRRPTLLAGDPLGIVAAAAVGLSGDGRWDRVKICPADDCRWAFYDRSKNRSRHWCSMEGCGTKAKSRAFRERQRAGPRARR
ncbi:MAG TPA: CGNR zinc finger domain-containing protein, partial [Mycobacteriales bacterium]|nr:CGNR zinc finger domain-containing protein [Mycobacteriales bacterium]